jgi:hypothetical protein
MSYGSRGFPSHIRNASTSLGGSAPASQSPLLVARIAEKKQELANLKELQMLSAGLADQMQMLADKLSTLSDGTEGTRSITLGRDVLAGWRNSVIGTDVFVLVQRLRRYYRIGITC